MTNDNTTRVLAAAGSLTDDYLRMERRLASRRALRLILAGRRDQALLIMARSVGRQARIAGLGTWDIPVPAAALYGPAAMYGPVER